MKKRMALLTAVCVLATCPMTVGAAETNGNDTIESFAPGAYEEGQTVEAQEEIAVSEDDLDQAGRTVPHYDIREDGGNWDGTHYYLADGTLATDVFFCDGTYTYYLQKDGTPMTDRLTYHPNGENIIYFDANGHEVFDNFINVKKSIAGEPVDDICYFNTFGYMYVDETTYWNGNAYYLNAYGVMQTGGWFLFADGYSIGYANADGTLVANTFSTNMAGKTVYFDAYGKIAIGWITDGAYYYWMDIDDGHMVCQIPVNGVSSGDYYYSEQEGYLVGSVYYDGVSVTTGESYVLTYLGSDQWADQNGHIWNYGADGWTTYFYY